MELTEQQQKALGDISQKSSKKASEALSQFIGSEVSLELNKPHLEPIENVESHSISQPEVYVMFEVMGDAPGYFLILTSKDTSLKLLEMVKKTQFQVEEKISEIDIDALGEVSNIIASSYLGELSNSAKINFVASVPTITQKFNKAVIKDLVHFLDQDVASVLVIETVLKIGSTEFIGEAMLMLKERSIDIVTKSLSKS